MICNEDGEWINNDGHPGIALLCILIPDYCNILVVTNGYISVMTNGYRMGSKITLSCYVGHGTSTGLTEKNIECRDRHWYDNFGIEISDLYCERLLDFCITPNLTPETQFNVSSLDTFSLGTIIELKCKDGYTRNSGDSLLQCGVDEENNSAWINADSAIAETLQCVSSRFFCKKSLDELMDDIPHTRIISLQPLERSLNTQVTLTCDYGYIPKDTIWTLICCCCSSDGSNGDWRLTNCDNTIPINSIQCEKEALCDSLYDNEPKSSIGTRLSYKCPVGQRLLLGDPEIECTIGGKWRAIGSNDLALLTAIPVECMFEDYHGVSFKANSYKSILPNIDIMSFEFDRAFIQGYIKPSIDGIYTFFIRLRGRATVQFSGEVIAAVNAVENEEEFECAGSWNLNNSTVYDVSVEYDTVVGGSLHLLWDGPQKTEREVIPPVVWYHTLESLSGFPRPLVFQNDTNPCVAETIIPDLDAGNSSIMSSSLDFDAGRYYEPNLSCTWKLYTANSKRYNFTFTVNTFDLETSGGCAYDSFNIYYGSSRKSEHVGNFCGNKPANTVLLSKVSSVMFVEFVSDKKVEARGFEVSYSIEDEIVLPR